MPRDFHDYLHFVTLPPPIPVEVVMVYRTEAWQVASELFWSTRRTIQWERRIRHRNANKFTSHPQESIGEEVIQEIYFKHFQSLERQYNRLTRIPPEFRLIQPAELESPNELAASLGRFVVHGSHNLVNAIAA